MLAVTTGAAKSWPALATATPIVFAVVSLAVLVVD
jgi:hypothetical protein